MAGSMSQRCVFHRDCRPAKLGELLSLHEVLEVLVTCYRFVADATSHAPFFWLPVLRLGSVRHNPRLAR